MQQPTRKTDICGEGDTDSVASIFYGYQTYLIVLNRIVHFESMNAPQITALRTTYIYVCVNKRQSCLFYVVFLPCLSAD
ncbi:hypothetical protein Y032_0667g1340 [Ancylostoma ceylanicum]|uniref:Uncharacterized protein n=1 Tax=Ancylostoma ceylanicum TaxID=53326 RepID=A0A016WHD7_9BILA|nr:hypothetical protein Y032_0667g1340 [Ancylostoma ceylanicum]